MDSHLESVNLLDDLGHLCQIELPTDKFTFPDNTRVRLTLIATATSAQDDIS